MKYNVSGSYRVDFVIPVEAESKDEAIHIVANMPEQEYIKYQFSNYLDTYVMYAYEIKE